MLKQVLQIMAAAIVLACCGRTLVMADEANALKRFAVAEVRFEQNATDGDVEAVFDAIGDDDGLQKLSITAPDGRTIVEFSGAGKFSMGIREFHFESPEPKDVAAVKRAFPEGEYTFTGITAGGAKLQSSVKLSHALPPTTSVVSPKANARNLAAKNLKIEWASVNGVSGYALELAHDDSNASMEVKLPASATSFAVPDGFLIPGGNYQLGIGTISSAGNVSYIETELEIAGDK
jgi:hypothetical protein